MADPAMLVYRAVIHECSLFNSTATLHGLRPKNLARIYEPGKRPLSIENIFFAAKFKGKDLLKNLKTWEPHSKCDIDVHLCNSIFVICQ